MVVLDVLPNDIVTIHGVMAKREVPAISPTAGMTVESVEVAGAVTSGVIDTIVIGDWTSQVRRLQVNSCFHSLAMLTLVNSKPASPATHSLFSHKCSGVSVDDIAVRNRHSGSRLDWCVQGPHAFVFSTQP